MRVAAVAHHEAGYGGQFLEPCFRAIGPREVFGMCSLIPDFTQCLYSALTRI
jgi:hypothetical protein